MIAGEVDAPPIAHTIGFTMTAIGDGTARFERDADPDRHANPMGTLHGGILCDLADGAMGMAFASTLSDLAECDVTDADGALVARASSTCMVLRGEKAAGR